MATSNQAAEGEFERNRSLDRRAFLGLSAGVAGAALLSPNVRAAASTKPAGSDLGAIDHVIFMMMENRSFDHYFGMYPGVRGFDDHKRGQLGAFSQSLPALPGNDTVSQVGRVLPFRLDTVRTANAECTFDLTHNWGPQHQCWNHGKMNRFVDVHTEAANEGPSNGLLTMSYYTRMDLPYYYALADGFTIGDAYHCSVFGPTDPNRMMQMSGTIDPSGKAGGPILTTSSFGQTEVLWSCHWDTMPEVLEDAGISWKYYRPPGTLYTVAEMEKIGIFYDTVLPYFAQYRNPSSALHQKAFEFIYPDDFVADLHSGKLPKVSWIAAPVGYDDHPPSPPALGMWFIDQLLRTLSAVPEVWSRTVVFVMYDENDGFFDHVPPPVAPKGTPGEHLTVRPLPETASGIAGPIGLGFRVPLLVLSPFSRGGYVCSETFDHTSQLRFLEARFGVKVPNISSWRRKAVGDLTSTLHLSTATTSLPPLPPTSADVPAGCSAITSTLGVLGIHNTGAPLPLPDPQGMPVQEPGRPRRLRGR